MDSSKELFCVKALTTIICKRRCCILSETDDNYIRKTLIPQINCTDILSNY